MVEQVVELRSMPLWLMQAYLEELGGVLGEDGWISGQAEGWKARLTPMEDFVLGSLRVGQVRMEWQGDDPAYQTVWPLIRKKLIRGGG